MKPEEFAQKLAEVCATNHCDQCQQDCDQHPVKTYRYNDSRQDWAKYCEGCRSYYSEATQSYSIRHQSISRSVGRGKLKKPETMLASHSSIIIDCNIEIKTY